MGGEVRQDCVMWRRLHEGEMVAPRQAHACGSMMQIAVVRPQLQHLCRRRLNAYWPSADFALGFCRLRLHESFCDSKHRVLPSHRFHVVDRQRTSSNAHGAQVHER